MRGLGCVSLSVLVACGAERRIVELPSFEGMRTLVVQNGPDVRAFDLETDPALTFEWEASPEPFVLAAYRATPEQLLMEVDASGALLPAPEGEPIADPSVGHMMFEEGTFEPLDLTRWARPRVAGHTCPRLRRVLLQTEVVEIQTPVLMEDGERVLFVGLEEGTLNLYQASTSSISLITKNVRAIFPARAGGIWASRPGALVRLGPRLEELERISTEVLPFEVVRGFETATTPRFYLLVGGGGFRIHSWDGVGAAVDLMMPRKGHMPQLPRFSFDAGGVLWVAEGTLVGEYHRGAGWNVFEMSPPTAQDVSEVLAESPFGPVYVMKTRFDFDRTITKSFTRTALGWEPLLPDDFIDNRSLLVHEGALLSTFEEYVVSIIPRREERPASRCQVAENSATPTGLVSTRVGVFMASLSALRGEQIEWLLPE